VIKKFLGCGLDWLTFGLFQWSDAIIELLPDVEFKPCGGIYREAGILCDGVRVSRGVREGLGGGVPPLQVQFQGQFFARGGNFLDFVDSTDRISRLDWRIDYTGEFFDKPSIGKVGEFSDSGTGTGWKLYSAYYGVRNYDKTEESQGLINSVYQVEGRVIRLEVQVNSHLLSAAGVRDVHGAMSLGIKKLGKIVGVKFDGPLVKYKKPTLDGQIKYWRDKMMRAKSKMLKLEILREGNHAG